MKLLTSIAPAFLMSATASAGAGEHYDLVLNGGLVMDPESGLQAIRNVAVDDGKIVAISEHLLVGDRVINAMGRIVAPGFIDLHSHAHNSLIGGRVQAFDGVTTALVLEEGQLPVDMAYAKAARQGRAINYGYSVSWAGARMAVMSNVTPDGTWEGLAAGMAKPEWVRGRPDEKQAAEIVGLIEQGLDQGGLGIGLPLGYAPGASGDEIFRLSNLAAERNIPVFVHTRRGVDPFLAAEEAIADAASTGAQWHIHHLWGDKDEFDLLSGAAKRGVAITAETLIWQSGSTYINAAFFDSEAARRSGLDPKTIIYYGRPVASLDELIRLQKDDPGALIVQVRPDDESVPALRAETALRLKDPDWILASDAMPWTDYSGRLLPGDIWPLPSKAWSHPRSAATYSRAIQKYVNEWNLLKLMDVLVAGSLNPARVLEQAVPQMRNKGRLKVGADADIIVFNPAKVKAVATIENPALLSTGMEYVLVNGVILIDRGRLNQKVFPGRPVRRSVKEFSDCL